MLIPQGARIGDRRSNETPSVSVSMVATEDRKTAQAQLDWNCSVPSPVSIHKTYNKSRCARAEAKRREDLLFTTAGNETAVDRPPLVVTYHPKNVDVCNIILRNYSFLRDDHSTRAIFNKRPLKAFRRAKISKIYYIGHSSLPSDPQHQVGTSPCNRRDCRTCPFVNSRDRIRTNNGQIKISGHYTCITS